MRSAQEITEEIRNLLMETVYEPEDLFDRPHPELREGEVFIGLVEYTASKEGKTYEAFSSTSAMHPFVSRRLGEKELAVSTRKDGWTPYDYHRPVFVNQEEYDTYLETVRI